MSYRRAFLFLGCGAMLTALVRPALAQSTLAQSTGDRAIAFVKITGDQILGVMRASASVAERRKTLGPIIDKVIDVDGLARFCLGRFWRTATPDQQKRYSDVFHQVLIGNITTRLGEYQEVRLTVGRSQTRDDTEIVASVVERPNNPPTTVEWVVADPAANPKVIDIVAEGTSLRLTQRSDYAAYLSRNNNSVDALIEAMKQQLAQ